MTTLPTRIGAVGKRARRRIMERRAIKRAVLGNGNGRVYAQRSNGAYVYVRYRATVDENGDATYSLPITLPVAENAIYYVFDGAPVLVGWHDLLGQAVLGADPQGTEAAGLSLAALNPGEPRNKFVHKKNIVDGASYPVATGNTNSLLVTVYPYPYYDGYGSLELLPGTPLQSDKLDLSSFMPAAGLHRIVVIFARTMNNTYYAVASTVQDIETAFDTTDYDECFTQAEPESMPIQAYALKDSEATITQFATDNDLRQIWNVPQTMGFPFNITGPYRIRSTRRVLTYGRHTCNGSRLEVCGGLRITPT